MRKKLVIKASTYDEAVDKIIKDYREEALKYFLCEDCDTLEFEYGIEASAYKENNKRDYKYQGVGKVTFNEFHFTLDETIEIASKIVVGGCDE